MKIEPFYIVLLISLLLASGTYATVSTFKSLPSPILGGDIYHQQGYIEHVLAGGDIFSSSSIIGRMPIYLPVYTGLVALFAIISGSDAFHAMLYFSVIIAFLIPIMWFVLLKKFVMNEWIAVVGVALLPLILYNPLSMPVMKYSDFTLNIMWPLFLIFLYRAYENLNLKNVALLALVYSLLALSHTVFFVSATIIVGYFLCYGLLSIYKNKEDFIESIRNRWKTILAFVVVASPILILYWYKPIFVYHLKMVFDRTHMDIPDFANPEVQIWFILDTVSNTFFNFTSIKSFFFIFSIVFFIINLKNVMSEEKLRFLAILFVAATSAVFSYFITEPLFHMNFICNYIVDLIFRPSLFLLGIYFLDRLEIEKILGKTTLFILMVAAIGLILLAFSAGEESKATNRFFKNTEEPLPDYIISISAYVKQNTSVNDVFLTTKELGFMLNSLTGRKLVTNRWAHQSDPYVYTPQKDIDAAIMLYGNNDSERVRLLKEYNVSYVYWDASWAATEYNIMPNGEVYPFDPLMALDTPSAREQFYNNGIKFISTTTWLDPAIRFWYVRQYKILIVTPENYRSFDRPWNAGLDSYLQEVWSYTENGKRIAVLYKVKRLE
ncbi:MAG: hypothetical protein QXD51_04015 [Candidatus Anstonellales archaeon]